MNEDDVVKLLKARGVDVDDVFCILNEDDEKVEVVLDTRVTIWKKRVKSNENCCV